MPALEGQEVPGAGKGILRGPRESGASRQGSPWVRQGTAMEAPRVPKAGQQVTAGQGRLAGEGLRAQVLGMTRGPASAKPGAHTGLGCWGLVEGQGVWVVPRRLGCWGLARRWMPEATGHLAPQARALRALGGRREAPMDPVVQGPWGLTQTSGTGHAVVVGRPAVKWALSLAPGAWGERGPAVPMAQGILGGSALQMGPAMVMAQGRQEEQSLGKLPGGAPRCLEAKAVTVLQEAGLADSLASRTGQEALVEGPRVKPGHVRGLGTHPEVRAMLALGERIAPVVASGVWGQWGLLGKDTEGQNRGALGE